MMKTSARRLALAFVLFGCGYISAQTELLSFGQAQPPQPGAQAGPQLGDEAIGKIKDANAAIETARQALLNEQKYQSAIQPNNAFAILAGGVNAVEDLETGRGVDPETFAALYAGLATDEVAANLGKDEDGRLTYKDKLVRIYSISRLRAMFAQRAVIAGDGDKKR